MEKMISLKRKKVEPHHTNAFLYRALYQVAWFYFRSFHRLSITGFQYIPTSGPAILVSNHPSYYDPLLLHMGSPRIVHFMAWNAAFKVPLLGSLIEALGAIPVDPDKSPNPGAFRMALRTLKENKLLGVFPEGGRTSFEEGKTLNEFREGAIKLAYLTGAPIVPAVITGAGKVWPRLQKFPRIGKISVAFQPAISVPQIPSQEITAEKLKTLSQEIRNLILRELEKGKKK